MECYSVDETQKHVKWKESDTKVHIFYYSTKYELSRIGKSMETDSKLEVDRGEMENNHLMGKGFIWDY